MVNRNTRKQANRRRKRSLKRAYFLTVLILLLSSIFIYGISFESKTHFLKCEGNDFYSDQEIFKNAGIDTDTRLWFTPSMWIEYCLLQSSMIENVHVEKSGDTLTLHVEEKMGIGYFVDKENTYILTNKNESIPVKENELKHIVLLYPMLDGFTTKERERLAQSFYNQKDHITSDLIKKISQIVPYKNSFEENMIQVRMYDGNTLYSSLDSISMLPNYQKIINKLDEKYACLFLDGDNNDIVKSPCSSFDQNARFLEDAQKHNEIEQNLNQSEVYEFEDTGIYDWEYIEIYNLYYSASENLYMYSPTRTYYRLDEQTYSFYELK